jgi:hypothetical protein
MLGTGGRDGTRRTSPAQRRLQRGQVAALTRIDLTAPRRVTRKYMRR